MRWVIFLLLAVFAISSCSSLNNKNPDKNMQFKTFTAAVCSESGDFVRCRDELFVNCSGKISKAANGTECNGINVEGQKITGFAVFEKDWQDPRK